MSTELFILTSMVEALQMLAYLSPAVCAVIFVRAVVIYKRHGVVVLHGFRFFFWLTVALVLAHVFLLGKDALIANEARSKCLNSAVVEQCVQDTRKSLEEQ